MIWFFCLFSAFFLGFLTPRRLSLPTTSSTRGVPDSFLFPEDLRNSDSLTPTNPVFKVWESSQNPLYNQIRIKGNMMNVEYYENGKEAKSFDLKTGHLLFPEDQDNGFSIFAFKNTHVSGSNIIKAHTDPSDFFISDLFWALYFTDESIRGDEDFAIDPQVSGLENLIVFSNHEEGDPRYLDSSYIHWTVFSYGSGSNEDFSTNTPQLDFPNVLYVYGNSWGYDLNTYKSPNLLFFFENLDFLAKEDGVEVNCSSIGIKIKKCQKIPSSLKSNPIVKDEDGNTRELHRVLDLPGVIVSFSSEGAPMKGDEWALVFPWTQLDSENPLFGVESSVYIGLMDEDGSTTLRYLSGSQNGNSFGPGLDDRNWLFTGFSSSASLASLKISSTETQKLVGEYEDENNRPDGAVWIDPGADGANGLLTSNAMFRAVCGQKYCQSGTALIMLCFDEDYRGDSFAIGGSSCFNSLDYGSRYCMLCLLEDSPSTSKYPSEFQLTDFKLPASYGGSFPPTAAGYLFGVDGSLKKITNISKCGVLWSPGPIYLEEQSRESLLYVSKPAQMLRFNISTTNGLDSFGKIFTQKISGISAMGLYNSTLQEETRMLCFIKSFGPSNDSSLVHGCSFSFQETADIWVQVYEAIPSGLIEVSLYGIGTTSHVNEGSFLVYSVQTISSSGEVLDETDDLNRFSIIFKASYAAQSIGITSEFDLNVSGTISDLFVTFSIHNRVLYESDYIQISINSSELLLEKWNFCEIRNKTSQKWSSAFSKCRIEANAVFLLPLVEPGSLLDLDGQIQVTLKAVRVPSSAVKITGNILTNDGFQVLSSSEKTLSIQEASEKIGELKASLQTSFYSKHGVLSVALTPLVNWTKRPKLWFALSPEHFQVPVFDSSVSCSVNGIINKCFEEEEGRVLALYDLKTNFDSDFPLEIEIEGIVTPRQLPESITIELWVIGFEVFPNPKAFSKAVVKHKDLFNSIPEAIYPRFSSVSTSKTRENADWIFQFSTPVFLPKKSIIKAYFPHSGDAIIQSGSSSCKMVLDESIDVLGSSCLFNGISSYSLKTNRLIDAGQNIWIEISRVSNPDEAICHSPFPEIIVLDPNLNLLGISLPFFHDSPPLTFEAAPNRLNVFLETRLANSISVSIGLFYWVEIQTESGFFQDEVSFYPADPTFSIPLSDSTEIGEGRIMLPISVDSDAHPGVRFLQIKTKGDLKYEKRLQVLRVDCLLEKGSVEINNGKSIFLEKGKISYPMPICPKESSLMPVAFSLSIDSNFPSQLTLNTTSFSLKSDCIFIRIQVSDEDFTNFGVSDGGTISHRLVVTPMNNFFLSETVDVFVVFSTGITQVSAIWTFLDIGSNGARMDGASNKETLNLVYMAPESEFNSNIDTFLEMKKFLTGEMPILGNTLFRMGVTESQIVEFDFEGDLVAGITYKYQVATIGNEDYEYLSQGTFGTLSTGEEAVVLVLKVLDENRLFSRSSFLCELAQFLKIPFDSLVLTSGVLCEEISMEVVDYYEFIEESQDEEPDVFSDFPDFPEILIEKHSSSSSDADQTPIQSPFRRNLQKLSEIFSDYGFPSRFSDFIWPWNNNFSDSSPNQASNDHSELPSTSSSDSGFRTLEIVVLPPKKSTQNQTVTNDLIEANKERLENEMNEYFWGSASVEILEKIEHFTYEYPTPSNYFSYSVSSSSILAYGLEVNETGSICFILYEGSVVISKNDVLIGRFSGGSAISFGCSAVSSNKEVQLEFEDLEADTQYDLAYFFRSIDQRLFAPTSEVYTGTITTLTQTDDVEEEELHSIIPSLPLTLLLFLGLLYSLAF